jgi:hypothetical protein
MGGISSRVGVIGLAVMALAGSGCGASPALQAADRGDFPAVQREVAAREKTGRLRNQDAADLARAVAGWEVAKGPPNEQLARVREARACARALDDALANRMKTRDTAGAEAALARVEAGEMSEADARAHVADVDDAWRAVGARGLVRAEDEGARQTAYLDPAPGVRRAALHAAAKAQDARDVEPLAEAARVDPEPIVRTDAVRTLAAIGGAEVVAKLRDLWTAADEPIREDIALAWASPALWALGGRDELRVLLAQGRGPGAIEAAGAVLRGGNRDPEADASATALLARTVAKGSHRDRLHAIAITPSSSPPVLEALREAANDTDFTVHVAALGRLLESKPDREPSIRALEAIAGDKDRVAAASRAKLALATAGDLKIQAWIEADLAAEDPSTRLGAATALSALGRVARAAPLLADADPSVRTRAACTILLAAQR